MEFAKDQDLSGFFDESIATVNIDDLTQKVESSIMAILKMAHTDARRHRFRKGAKSISFPCPICGDSATDSTKMRGHIYLAYGLYKCYNNNDCSCSLDEFFRRFGIDGLFTGAELQEIQKIASNSRAEIYSARQAVSYTEIDDIAPYLFDKQVVVELYDAVEMEKDSYARSKIASRQIPNSKMQTLLWLPTSQCLLILNMHNATQKVLSIVKRQMRLGFLGPKYLTVQYSELLSIRCGLRSPFKNPQEPILPEEIAEKSGVPVAMITKLDVTCQFYNALNIDWNDDIFVFEGPIDSFYMPNSMAFGGTGVDLKYPTFHYIYDDDAPGRKEACKRLDEKLPVFMWKKFLQEHQVYKKPYNQKVDFNDMWIKQPFEPSLIKQYFTNNPFNKLSI